MSLSHSARRAIVIPLGIGLVAATLGPASAAKVDITSNTVVLSTKASFDINQETWSSRDYVTPIVAIDDGSRGASPDAFDGGLGVVVDNVGVTTRGGVAKHSGDSLTTRPVTMSGLKVTVTYQAIKKSPTVRLLVKLVNDTRNDKKRTIGVRSNMGSDSSTVVQLSSSGDQSFDRGDRWVTTRDNSLGGTDPMVSQIFAGRGAPVPTSAYLHDDDDILWDLPVRVRDHSTRYLMFFARFDATYAPEAALNAMGDFNKRHLTKKLRAGLSKKVKKAIVNWDL